MSEAMGAETAAVPTRPWAEAAEERNSQNFHPELATSWIQCCGEGPEKGRVVNIGIFRRHN